MQIEQGVSFASQARTITETDIVSFCGLSGDFTPIHSDAEFARTTPYGERTAHGLWSCRSQSGCARRQGSLAIG